MLRFILLSLLMPILQRLLPQIIKAVMDGVQSRNSGEQSTRNQPGQTEYEREAESFSGRVYKIVDGDSLYVEGHQPQIRLWGVDAPEKHEIGYNQAAQTLRDLAFDEVLRVEVVSIDKYGRTLGRCYHRDGKELNHEMIKTGDVKEYFRYTKGYYRDLN